MFGFSKKKNKNGKDASEAAIKFLIAVTKLNATLDVLLAQQKAEKEEKEGDGRR